MSQAPPVERPRRSGHSTNSARRDELADLLFGYIGGLKRRLMASVPEELKGEFGAVTWHQVGALEQLRAATETSSGATMNEIARMQQCALSSASALVDRMIRLGFAERLSDVDDRRIIHIVPSRLGLQMLDRFDEARKAVALEALAPLTDADLEQLVGLMGRIVDWPEPAHAKQAAHD
ncbi:MAG: MarR family winged helix-turn-helix transcriptional regulator [Candidatus Dormibacteria bacterium]